MGWGLMGAVTTEAWVGTTTMVAITTREAIEVISATRVAMPGQEVDRWTAALVVATVAMAKAVARGTVWEAGCTISPALALAKAGAMATTPEAILSSPQTISAIVAVSLAI